MLQKIKTVRECLSENSISKLEMTYMECKGNNPHNINKEKCPVSRLAISNSA